MRSPMQSTVRPGIAWLRASKSNIWLHNCSLFEHDLFGKPVPTFPDHARCPSAKTIGAIEKALHVRTARVFQRGEAAIVAGAQQPIDLALGEVLISVAD